MNLVILHGPPAVGKFTIAQELANITGYKLFHNHLTADLASSIFDTGTKEYSDLVEKIRLDVFENTAKNNLPGLIFTFVYGIETFKGKNDDKFIKKAMEILRRNHGQILFVKLACNQKVLEKRLAHPSRKKFNKLQSVELLKKIQKDYDLARTIPYGKSLAGMVAYRTSDFLTFLNIIATGYLLVLAVSLTVGKKLFDYQITDYIGKVIRSPFIFFSQAWQTIMHVVTLKTVFSEHNKTPNVIRGLLITIPLLVAFGLLFYSADLIFKHYIDTVIDLDINPETIVRMIIVLVVSYGLVGVLSFLAERINIPEVISSSAKLPNLGSIELTMLLAGVNILFLSFIIIQLAYLFGGQVNIATQGFTYADYARRGFFELIAVAIIASVIIYKSDQTIRKYTDRMTYLTVLSGALVVQVGIIMASAFKRLLLYEQAYGFTTSRLYGHFFIIWLGIVLVMMLYKIILKTREQWFAHGLILSVMMMLIFINFFNPDRFIAKQNIDRALAEGNLNNLDTWYLNQLSDDAMPEIIRVLDAPHAVQDTPRDSGEPFDIRRDFARELYYRGQWLVERAKPWQSYNVARNNALEILNSKAAFLEENKNYQPDLPSDLPRPITEMKQLR